MATFRPIESGWTLAFAAAERSRSDAGKIREPKAEERLLIERAQEGDHDAFARLLSRHQRRVFSLIGNLIRQPAEVEDIAQQVFLKMYLALPQFDFRAAFSTWLYRIAVNECYDHLRRQRAQKSPAGKELQVEELADLERLGATVQASASPDPARQAELRQLVEQLFRRLPVDDRLLLTLKELEGFSIEEIARVMEMKENTVKVRLFRARRRLLERHRRLSARRPAPVNEEKQ